MVYTLEERKEMLKIYFQNNDCARATARIFNERHPDKNVYHSFIIQLVHKFEVTGSVANKKHNRTRTVTGENDQVAVIGQLMAEREQCGSVRKLSQETGYSRASVHRILKLAKFHPYKMTLVHELNEDDGDRRMEFCQIISQEIIANPVFLYNVCFSDECTFFLNGNVNKHNCRFWSDENPHLFREQHSQHPQKLNVWMGILGDHLIGPVFIPGNLTGDVYLDLLENVIDLLITEALEADENLLEEELRFQQDGAPPHFAAQVRQYLNGRFPGRWIGRRGPVQWPARSPDLTPLDFFLWGHLKSQVYKTRVADLDDLRARIVAECRNITPEMLQHVRNNFEERLYRCMQSNGEHFEHLR